MSNNAKFLAEFLDQDIYIIQDEKEHRSPENKVLPEKESDIKSDSEVAFKGSNSKGVLVVIDKDVDESQAGLLDSILGAVDLSRNDIALVSAEEDFEKIAEALITIESTKVVSFGVVSTRSRLLDIQAKYAPTTIEGRKVLLADRLFDLAENNELKRQLWNALKEIF